MARGNSDADTVNIKVNDAFVVGHLPHHTDHTHQVLIETVSHVLTEVSNETLIPELDALTDVVIAEAQASLNDAWASMSVVQAEGIKDVATEVCTPVFIKQRGALDQHLDQTSSFTVRVRFQNLQLAVGRLVGSHHANHRRRHFMLTLSVDRPLHPDLGLAVGDFVNQLGKNLGVFVGDFVDTQWDVVQSKEATHHAVVRGFENAKLFGVAPHAQT